MKAPIRLALLTVFLACLSPRTQASSPIAISGLPRGVSMTTNDLFVVDVWNGSTWVTKGISFSNFSSYITAAVRADTFGAVGNDSADDTAALQAALNYVCTSNSFNRLRIPAGTYKITSPLIITATTNIEIFGDGAASGFYPRQSKTVIDASTFASTASNAFQFVASATRTSLLRLTMHDMAIIGPTNSTSGAGIWLGQNFQADYGSVQATELKNLDLCGFANGLEMHDTVTTKCEAVHSMFNTNAAFALYRADSCDLKDCWGGWDGAKTGVKQTAIIANWNRPFGTGNGLGITILGGEWGNCYQFAYLDTCFLSDIIANHESIYSTNGLVQFTNQCQYTELGVRWASLTNITAPIWRVFNNPGGQYNSGIVIINPTVPYETGLVSVEGNPFGDMPILLSPGFLGYTNMVFRSSIGGAVTTTFVGGASVPDKNQLGTWTQKQTMLGGVNIPPLRLQNGYNAGGAALELGGDTGASTLTANVTKYGIIAGVPYTGTGYTIGAMQHLGDVSGNYLDLGNATGLTSEDFIRIYTGGSERWLVNNNGALSAQGGNPGIQLGNIVINPAAGGGGNNPAQYSIISQNPSAQFNFSGTTNGAFLWGTNSQMALNGSGMGVLSVNGGGVTNTIATFASLSADTSLKGYEEVVTETGAHAVTLGDATTNKWHRIAITCSSVGTNAIKTVSAQTIAGATSWTNLTIYSCTQLISDGANWQLCGARGN